MPSLLPHAAFESMIRRKPDYGHIPVLLVDDEPAALDLCKRLLERLGFRDITSAGDGTGALSMLKERKFGVVISDWNMPNMTGIQLLRELRAGGNAVPFGFVTSEGSPEMRDIAEKAGAMFVIAKPFTADTFSDALGRVLV